jgi:adenosylcobinamide kinase/adenosylcobinamide-phosphate guanylyltransferase
MQDAPAVPARGTILLEDLGNLVANGWEGCLEELLTCTNLVIVGNEVGCDGVRYQGFTREYIARLGSLSCRLAERSDAVVEVVAGLPRLVKGNLGEVAPWVC